MRRDFSGPARTALATHAAPSQFGDRSPETAPESLAARFHGYRAPDEPSMTAAPRTRKRPKAAPPPEAPAEGFVPLKTERLTLRPFRPDDATDLHRLINDFDVAKMLELVRFPYQRDLADEWIAGAARDLAAGTACHLAITGAEGAGEVLAGAVGITIDRPTRTGKLGYWVGQKFWGHGVATEAASRLTRWAFANLDVDRITATVADDNPASAAVLRRAGFRQTGTGLQHFASREIGRAHV